MDDREKLVELVCEVIQTEECNRHCNHPPCDMASDIADHLLAHGVTIREQGGYSDDDCFREKIEHQLKGIYEHLRDVDSAIDTLRAQTLPLRGNVIPWFKEATAHINVGGSECHCGAPMKGERNETLV